MAMEALHFPFKLEEFGGGSFNEKQEFASFFNFAFPAVMGLDGRAKDVDAGSEALFDDGTRDKFCLDEIGTGNEDKAIVLVRLHWGSPWSYSVDGFFSYG